MPQDEDAASGAPGPDELDLAGEVQPEALQEALTTYADELQSAADAHAPGDHEMVSVRTATYKGREIVVTTRYEIAIDGQPFQAHVGVGNAGRVHYHGLPTQDFASVIDLIEAVIDHFPDAGTAAPDEPGHEGHGHEGHGHDHGAEA